MENYHVLSRGNCRRDVFVDAADRLFFLSRLGRNLAEVNALLRGFVLMTNHFHIIASCDSEQRLRRAVGNAKKAQTNWMNDRHQWTGHLWEKRVRSNRVDHYMAAIAYVEENPVRHRIVKNALEWPWSSAAFYRLGVPNPLITPDHRAKFGLPVTAFEQAIHQIQADRKAQSKWWV